MSRPYDAIAKAAALGAGRAPAETPAFAGVSGSAGGAPGGSANGGECAMRAVVDACWDALHDRGVSWIGFYTWDHAAPADRAMTLGPSRNKPACSPIGLHGACGRAATTGRTLIVRDVADLGANYVACDPRDRSEIVIPLFDAPGGRCWGVLDADSFDLGAFNESDARGLKRVLHAAGFVTD